MGVSRKSTDRYVSLHSHSTFSYGDGFGPVKDHVERVANLGGQALALTEHGNVSSWAQLEKAAKKAGIKPIFGLEGYMAPPKQKRKFHQTILAMNQKGHRNLNQIVGRSWSEGFYQWPTIHGDMLTDHEAGLIVTSGCADSHLSCTLLGGKSLGDKRDVASQDDMRNAEILVRKYKEIFGDRYYLETQRFPGLARTRVLNPAFAELSRRTGVPLVATADVHYPMPEENELQKILHAAHRGSSVIAVESGWEYDILLTYPKSDAEVFTDLINTGLSKSEAWAAILATEEIAGRCNVELPKNEAIRFPTPKGVPARDLVWEWLREGWAYRFPDNATMQTRSDDYAARVKYEMELIVAKDYPDYFLVVADAVKYAKDHGIPVGPARGSAAASLVCYLLRITEVDPMQFPTMVFERFIDHGRSDLPDIDLDFSDDRRHEVIEYLVRTYGYDRVANIGNFTRYLGKLAINDVARVHQVPSADAEAIKQVIIERSGGDSRFDSTLADTIDMFPAAREALERNPMLKYALSLEGNMRGMSVHAAGVVLSNRPIADTCAMYTRETKGGDPRQVLAYDKKDAEYLGMLKMDFLGLSTMGMIGIVLDMIGMDLADLYRVPLTDQPTLDAFRAGDVVGIFQFEGRATRIVNAAVQPEHFMHLADINALSRPGPLFSGMTQMYADVRHGRSEPDHLHPMVWKYTQHTYGQIVYQEQVLSIIRELGGFPVAAIGDIRRIISQKLGEAQFQGMFEEFVKGAAKHNVDRQLATRIWKFMVTSATYSFNIAHCVSYSMLAFWCMWLKKNYPVEFYAAQLRKVGDNKIAREYKRPRLMNDAVKKGLAIGPPHPEKSGLSWNPEGTVIRAGFIQMPGIGAATAGNILQYRENFGLNDWSALQAVKGIGEATITKINEFCADPDPFDIELTARTLDKIRDGIRYKQRGYRGLPMPTHRSDTIPRDVPRGEHRRVTWMGVVRAVEHKDLIEDQRARTGATVDEILAGLKDPHLIKFCTLHCYDDGDDDVFLRFNRWQFPKFKELIAEIVPGEDVVIAIGKKRQGFGVSVAVDTLIVIPPEESEELDESDV